MNQWILKQSKLVHDQFSIKGNYEMEEQVIIVTGLASVPNRTSNKMKSTSIVFKRLVKHLQLLQFITWLDTKFHKKK